MARRVRSVAEVIAHEASNRGNRINDMIAIANVINNRARTLGVTPEQVVQRTSEFNAFNEEINPSLQKDAWMAERVMDLVETGDLPDPTNGATFYSTPETAGNLPPGLSAPTLDTHAGFGRGHQYRTDPANRSIYTSDGLKRFNPSAPVNYPSLSPERLPDGPLAQSIVGRPTARPDGPLENIAANPGFGQADALANQASFTADRSTPVNAPQLSGAPSGQQLFDTYGAAPIQGDDYFSGPGGSVNMQAPQRQSYDPLSSISAPTSQSQTEPGYGDYTRTGVVSPNPGFSSGPVNAPQISQPQAPAAESAWGSPFDQQSYSQPQASTPAPVGGQYANSDYGETYTPAPTIGSQPIGTQQAEAAKAAGAPTDLLAGAPTNLIENQPIASGGFGGVGTRLDKATFGPENLAKAAGAVAGGVAAGPLGGLIGGWLGNQVGRGIQGARTNGGGGGFGSFGLQDRDATGYAAANRVAQQGGSRARQSQAYRDAVATRGYGRGGAGSAVENRDIAKSVGY